MPSQTGPLGLDKEVSLTKLLHFIHVINFMHVIKMQGKQGGLFIDCLYMTLYGSCHIPGGGAPSPAPLHSSHSGPA